ncbi:hypothetical protein [Dolosigranulum pigrum]|uniref:Uncharacterized protein n=1 Tax=Dolosigranulum pigrum TaxID=29394 RepID=A0A516GLA7_9LACT|nr:hypothetical protein [Dolosigranulum pigrum]QDO92178.1 hypothetical protein FNV33_09300 [Dolosigranulum pigrum]QDO92243.1 hypothetical protein FNV33_09655 [Dolosigranulum pigrum]QDO92308.1 hypothetical protein FNV33_10010 [Dolosigranulum pigrum]
MLRQQILKDQLATQETIEVPKQIIAIFEEYDDIDRLYDDFMDGLFDERISRWFSRYFKTVVRIAFEKKNYVPMKQRYYVQVFKGKYGYMVFDKFNKCVSYESRTPALFSNESVIMTQFTENDIRLLDNTGMIPQQYNYVGEREPVDELEVDYETVCYVPVYDPEHYESNLFAMRYKDKSMKREGRFYV